MQQRLVLLTIDVWGTVLTVLTKNVQNLYQQQVGLLLSLMTW